jgi:hypothetical protein
MATMGTKVCKGKVTITIDGSCFVRRVVNVMVVQNETGTKKIGLKTNEAPERDSVLLDVWYSRDQMNLRIQQKETSILLL